MLRIAVCDDEPQIVKQLTDLVMQCAPDCELTCYAHGEELLEAQKTFDLIFLDIQMKPLNGMETAKRIRSLDEGVLIVFITAWKEYVFDAFDVGAFHYLLKPVQLQKLREILQRAQRETDRKNHAKKQQLFLKTRERSFVVNVEDILFLENALRKVVIHTDAQTILVYGTMSEFEKKAGGGILPKPSRVSGQFSPHCGIRRGNDLHGQRRNRLSHQKELPGFCKMLYAVSKKWKGTR